MTRKGLPPTTLAALCPASHPLSLLPSPSFPHPPSLPVCLHLSPSFPPSLPTPPALPPALTYSCPLSAYFPPPCLSVCPSPPQLIHRIVFGRARAGGLPRHRLDRFCQQHVPTRASWSVPVYACVCERARARVFPRGHPSLCLCLRLLPLRCCVSVLRVFLGVYGVEGVGVRAHGFGCTVRVSVPLSLCACRCAGGVCMAQGHDQCTLRASISRRMLLCTCQLCWCPTVLCGRAADLWLGGRRGWARPAR